MIRDDSQRTLLFDMDAAISTLRQQHGEECNDEYAFDTHANKCNDIGSFICIHCHYFDCCDNVYRTPTTVTICAVMVNAKLNICVNVTLDSGISGTNI